MVQPTGVPRFNEDSALQKHWPLIWISVLIALIVAGFVADFNHLAQLFNSKDSSRIKIESQFIFNNNRHSLSYKSHFDPGKKSNEILPARKAEWLNAGAKMARTITYNGYPTEPSESAAVQTSRNYIDWIFHRKLALFFVQDQDFEAAESELNTALDFARALPQNYPCKALSLGDLSLLAELRALEMQQASQLLIKVFLPIFSFLAALLPFALFVHFIKSRDKVTSARGEDDKASVALLIKSGLLTSWFGLIVTGWLCLRNIGLGTGAGLADPASVGFFVALGLFILACGLMLRYMPPYRAFSLKRTLVRSGFGGALLLIKAVAIYLGLCFSLAGHPALKDTLFFQSAYVSKGIEAKALAAEALKYQSTLADLPELQDSLIANADLIKKRIIMAPVDATKIDEVQSRLAECNQDLALVHNVTVPYLWDTSLKTKQLYGTIRHISMQNISVGMAVKSCLIFLLLCYPEFIAYICIGLRQNQWAFRTFAWAVRIKEYFLGVDHWLVVGMFELFGSCLLTFHKERLSQAGENYLREAISRYERSRGRHDELTIAAKMALAHFFTERGDDKEAERILLEALRDVAKDFDVLAYCTLMTAIGKLCRRQNNLSRAKQMYKQAIELLEQKLSTAPSSGGLVGYIRNLYATTPTWQLEIKLVHCYLDLAQVFQQAKYNGEVQRLIDEANRRVDPFECSTIVVMEVAQAYCQARLAQAKILCSQRRFDECFKLLESAKKRINGWGYGRYYVALALLIGTCELGLEAGRSNPQYLEKAKKNYQDGSLLFASLLQMGSPFLAANQGVKPEELRRLWRDLGEKLGLSPADALDRQMRPKLPADGSSAAALAAGRSCRDELAGSAAFSLTAKSIPSAQSETTQPTVEEGIILRWQRERKEEKMMELLPD